MKRLLISFLLITAVAIQAPAASNGIMDKMKRLFVGTPTPTPTPHKKKKTSSTSSKKHSPTATPRPSSSAKPKSSPHRTASPSPEPSATPAETPQPSSSATAEESPEESASAAESSSRTPEETPSPTPKHTPSPEETPSPSPKETPRKHRASPSPTATEREAAATPSPTASKGRTAPVSIAASEIIGYDKNPRPVREILDLALDLTTRNLGYKYGSADPSAGGMDCSGFIHYVLSQTGMKNVPRDAREQYIWVRKAGKFQAVLGKSPDTFELDALKPGDLLFWSGTYSVDRDPAITHTMIYLGREKTTNQRVMVGASDGRTYKGQSRYGVSVFDFKLAGRKVTSANEPGPMFVGYAGIPGLGEE